MWSKNQVIRILDDSIFELEVNYEILKQSELKVWIPHLPASANLDTARVYSAKACKIYSLHLHNYLNSFASLIDHTRKVIPNIENTKLKAEYEKEKKKYATIEVQVVKDLHNFSRHKHLPIGGQKVGLIFKSPEEFKKNNPSTISFSPPSLLIKDLLADKKCFNAKTTEYLQEQGDELILHTVLDKAHQSLVASSYFLYKKILML